MQYETLYVFPSSHSRTIYNIFQRSKKNKSTVSMVSQKRNFLPRINTHPLWRIHCKNLSHKEINPSKVKDPFIRRIVRKKERKKKKQPSHETDWINSWSLKVRGELFLVGVLPTFRIGFRFHATWTRTCSRSVSINLSGRIPWTNYRKPACHRSRVPNVSKQIERFVLPRWT